MAGGIFLRIDLIAPIKIKVEYHSYPTNRIDTALGIEYYFSDMLNKAG